MYTAFESESDFLRVVADPQGAVLDALQPLDHHSLPFLLRLQITTYTSAYTCIHEGYQVARAITRSIYSQEV